MTDHDFNSFELDDFPMSPTGNASAVNYIEAFTKAKQLLEQIPEKFTGKNRDTALVTLIKEIQTQQSAGSALFRKHLESDDALAIFWLARIRNLANIYVRLNQVPDFKGLNAEQMIEIGKYSIDSSNVRHLPEILAKYGIVLIFERYLTGMKLDGAVFMLANGTPVISLSLRFPRLDSLWFTLMHELAHVALHADRLETPIIDDFDSDATDLSEKEADKLALNSMISRSDWRTCPARYEFKKENVISFAKQIGVHPAIVAGRLRRELGRYDLYSDLVNDVDVRRLIWE